MTELLDRGFVFGSLARNQGQVLMCTPFFFCRCRGCRMKVVGGGWIALALVICIARPAAARLIYDGKELNKEALRGLMIKHAGKVLPLSETAHLDADEASLISSHASGVDLNGLTSLDDDLAKMLARNRGIISLNGVRTLSPGAASHLAQSDATLSLSGLTSLDSAELAQKLALQRGVVSLPLIKKVAESIADELSNAVAVSLPSLEQLDHRALASRLESVNNAIHLPKLTKISVGGAEGLVARPGLRLHLPALSTIDRPTAEVLSQHDSVLDLDGLVDADADVLTWVFQCQAAIDLGGLKSLGANPLPEKLLAAIEQHQAPVTLAGLTVLSPELAKAIRGRTSHTFLGGLKSIDLATAKELRQCRGTVWLTGLEMNGMAVDLIQEFLKQPVQDHVSFVLPSEMQAELPLELRLNCSQVRTVAFGNPVGK